MKKILFFVTLIAALATTGCRTTEANYRSAYETAKAGREQATPVDSTIYGKVRREMHTTMLVAGGDTVQLRTMHVSPTPDADGAKPVPIPAAYGVVAGQFKTLFNARSLRDRLRDNGFADASIVNTAEPYYYVVASWHADGAAAAAAMRALEKDPPVALREPLPFVLKPAGR